MLLKKGEKNYTKMTLIKSNYQKYFLECGK